MCMVQGLPGVGRAPRQPGPWAECHLPVALLMPPYTPLMCGIPLNFGCQIGTVGNRLEMDMHGRANYSTH